uniref:NADH dehydrogenase subunit 5 n=1 Tax=Rodentolepis nana TaxID=102285 RepID=A0A0R3TEB6_RODNA
LMLPTRLEFSMVAQLPRTMPKNSALNMMLTVFSLVVPL